MPGEIVEDDGVVVLGHREDLGSLRADFFGGPESDAVDDCIKGRDLIAEGIERAYLDHALLEALTA